MSTDASVDTDLHVHTHPVTAHEDLCKMQMGGDHYKTDVST